MLSFKAKRNIAHIFLVITLVPVLFVLPTFSKNDSYTAHAATITIPTPELNDWDCFGNMGICVVVYASWVLFIKIPFWLVQVTSILSNALFAYGLSSNAYNQPAFINPGWVICRDIANTFFIFILLYIAIMTILGRLGGQTKKLLMTVIVVALFMNFSMYITRFVIDVGNMLALEFYNAFPQDDGWHVTFPGVIERDISGGFMNNVMTPAQQMISLLQDKPVEEWWAWWVFIFVCIGAVLIVFIFVMLSGAFLMVGRVAMLWILMILSPLAFFAYALPQLSGRFGEWTRKLTEQVFFPVVFLFFVYLASRLAGVIGRSFSGSDGAMVGTDMSMLTLLIPTILQFSVIAAFLLFGLKMATQMAGAAGAAASKYLTMGTGAALGAGAWGARRYAGKASSMIQERLGAERMANLKTSVAGRIGLGALDKMQNSSFDIRNTKTFGMGAGAAGLNFGTGKGLTYAQKQQVGDKEREAAFKSLKTDEQKIDYINSLEGVGGDAFSFDSERNAREIMKTMTVPEQQRLINKATGKKKQFLQGINAHLAKNFGPEQHVEAIKGQEGDPKAQKEYVEKLLSRSVDANGKTVEAVEPAAMKGVMKGLTPSNRAGIEMSMAEDETTMKKRLAEDDTAATGSKMSITERAKLENELKKKSADIKTIKDINQDIYKDLKPREKEAYDVETKNFIKTEDIRRAKVDLRANITKYDDLRKLTAPSAAQQTEIDKITDVTAQRKKIEEYHTANAATALSAEQQKEMVKIEKSSKELVSRIGDNQITSLHEDEVTNPLVAKYLSIKQADKLNKSNTNNLSTADWDNIQAMNENVALSPAFTTQKKTTEEKKFWTPKGGKVKEEDLRQPK